MSAPPVPRRAPFCAPPNADCHLDSPLDEPRSLTRAFAGSDRAGLAIRPDPHMLIVGDPGLGKSQMLRAVSLLAPRSVYVGGNTTSTTGLTVVSRRARVAAAPTLLRTTCPRRPCWLRVCSRVVVCGCCVVTRSDPAYHTASSMARRRWCATAPVTLPWRQAPWCWVTAACAALTSSTRWTTSTR